MRLNSWLRRPKVALLAAGVILAILALQIRFDPFQALPNGACDTSLCCPECRTLRVNRVIDGDTFDSPEGRVRLFGVDTPERDEKCYGQAADRFSNLAGSSVRVELGERASDPNGRFLFYVYTKRGESIEEKLVREGLGRAWTGDGQHRDLLVELERQARRDGSGCLWQ